MDRQPFEYNKSKARSEQLLRRLRTDGRVEVVTLRPWIVFGPRSTYWTAQLADDLLAGTAYLVDGGRGVCNTVFVDNLVEAQWLAATIPGAANQDFFIRDGEDVSWFEFYDSVARALGHDMSVVPSLASSDAAMIVAERARAKRFEDFRPLRQEIGRVVRRFMSDRLAAIVPRRLKDAVVGRDPGTHSLELDPELVSLQSCRFSLPMDKAHRLLGYRPPVSFREASARTAAWLRYVLCRDLT